VGAGRSGFAVLRRLRPFDVRLHYTDPCRLPLVVESDLGLIYHPNAATMVPACDVVTIHCPLQDRTARMFDADMMGQMKRGAYLVNTAQGGICDPDAIAHALESGKLAGYATDAAAKQLPSGMQVHVAGSTLSAQARYAAGTREILECWFEGEPIRNDYLIIDRGRLTNLGSRCYGIRHPAPSAPHGGRMWIW
jgi:formate dehydrogenase